MPDIHLANLSNQLMLATVLAYVIAMIGYAADLAFGERQAPQAMASPQRVLVAAGHPGTVETGGVAQAAEDGEPRPSRWSWRRVAVAVNALGWMAHLAEITTRGMAAHRVPWGNMYEFLSAITFATVTVYLVWLWRAKVCFLGSFVMVAVVVGLGAATLVFYDDPGPLRPALNSYWIAIHVSAAITATGTFAEAAVAAILCLAKRRAGNDGGIIDRLPSAETFDRISHRTIMFAFPIWTFAVIAGAMWADSAWGRYWGWDPKETWSFITWVVYAAYLHARATAGWPQGHPHLPARVRLFAVQLLRHQLPGLRPALLRMRRRRAPGRIPPGALFSRRHLAVTPGLHGCRVRSGRRQANRIRSRSRRSSSHPAAPAARAARTKCAPSVHRSGSRRWCRRRSGPTGADSRNCRNTRSFACCDELSEERSGGLPAEGLAGAVVEFGGDGSEVFGGVDGQVGAFREVLAE
jgi:cytochrome c-type biogenesis protein CcsB